MLVLFCTIKPYFWDRNLEDLPEVFNVYFSVKALHICVKALHISANQISSIQFIPITLQLPYFSPFKVMIITNSRVPHISFALHVGFYESSSLYFLSMRYEVVQHYSLPPATLQELFYKTWKLLRRLFASNICVGQPAKNQVCPWHPVTKWLDNEHLETLVYWKHLIFLSFLLLMKLGNSFYSS